MKPVDVESLPVKCGEYRAERAKNWPTARRVAASEEDDADAEARRAERHERLREILARQRELGHFDASEKSETWRTPEGNPERGKRAPRGKTAKGKNATAEEKVTEEKVTARTADDVVRGVVVKRRQTTFAV